MIINRDNFEDARRDIERVKSKNKDEDIIVVGRDIEFNRKALEMKKVNSLILNHGAGKDRINERGSGLNEVLCRIAEKKNITFIFDFSELATGSKKERALVLSRFIQNLRLIRKHKNKLRVINFGDDRISLSALLRVLGADSKMAIDSVEK